MTDRRAQIMAAATTLFLEEGVGVSTARIAQAAGVSNGTLFNAFPTKQTLIDTIYKTAKTEMFAALGRSDGAPLTRETLYRNWCGYLDWAHAHPERRRIMHLLLDAGLASAGTRAEVDAIAAPYAVAVQAALDAGLIRGPGVSFIGRLIMLQLDLVITENLNRSEADMAFDMLCTSIGLTQ